MMNITFPRALVASFVLLMASSVADAADESAEELTRLLKLRLGTDQVEAPTETDVEGVYQTRFGNKFAYLIEGGRYVFIGDMVDLKLAKNLTELSRRNLLSVFTDTSCGYCQKLHQEVRYLQEAGISVHYFPYPRGGSRGPGYSDMRKVWCSDDQRKAMSIAKGSETGSLESSDSCELAQHVDDGYLLGNRIGVNGTPALYSSDGSMFNGYVPYQQLIPQLINNQ
jgi:thiol:disulfide interchange protein DsbC